MKKKITLTDADLSQMPKEQLVMMYRLLQEKYTEVEKRLDFLHEQISLANREKYGASSEKRPYEEGVKQLAFFNDVEMEAAKASGMVPEAEPEDETITIKEHKRKKEKGKPAIDLSNLPVEKIRYMLAESEMFCSTCSGPLRLVTTETTERLKYIPAHFVRVEEIVGVYSCGCPACNKMVRAPKPASLLRGSIATPSLVSAIMNAKYVNGMPLARQETEFKRNGINLDRQKMAYWVVRCSEDYLSLLYDEMKKHLLQCKYNQADETRVQVLHEDGRKATSESWMWVYRTGEKVHSPPVILFSYEQTRAGEHPKAFLAGYEGYLTTDAYSAYRKLPESITITGCMTHARRGFHDALMTIDADKRKGTIADEAIKRIAILYQIETMAKDKSADERLHMRQTQSKPLLEAFFAWLKDMEPAADSRSLIGKAINYALNQQEYLSRYLLDGNIPIDNSATERSIRPFAQGRRAWLFCNTPNGAKASAMVYSIVETAKANKLHPYNYMTHVLETMPNFMNGTSRDFIQDLLPWSSTLPDKCRVERVDLT